MTDQDSENAIQATGADVAPRVTLVDIEAAIAHECYFNAADPFRFAWLTDDVGSSREEAQRIHRERQINVLKDMQVQSYAGACTDIDANASIPDVLKRLTFCIIVLRNGFTLVGKSACVSPENFNAEIGRKVAREDAINQAWPLFGFALAEELYRTNQPGID